METVVATNITVAPLPAAAPTRGPFDTLADLQPAQTARVVEIAPTCQGPQRRRLLDLGLVPDTPVEAVFGSAFGGPMAYRIRGALIALRREQAELVRIRRGSESPTG